MSYNHQTNLQELQPFLGLLNHYGRFISHQSTITHQLNSYTRESGGFWVKNAEEQFFVEKKKDFFLKS